MRVYREGCGSGAEMKKTLRASLSQEGQWYVAQCLEIDVASQGKTEKEALESLREALALHFEDPQAGTLPEIHPVEVEVGGP